MPFSPAFKQGLAITIGTLIGGAIGFRVLDSVAKDYQAEQLKALEKWVAEEEAREAAAKAKTSITSTAPSETE